MSVDQVTDIVAAYANSRIELAEARAEAKELRQHNATLREVYRELLKRLPAPTEDHGGE